MGDVTRRWPRPADLRVLEGVVEDAPCSVAVRAERDAATADALRAYLRVVRPERAAQVDVLL